MSKFEVGQRVVAYDGTRMVGRIVAICPSGTSVQFESEWSGATKWMHPKQLRRLVRRKRRELWLKWSIGAKQWVECKQHGEHGEFPVPCIHVREARSGEGGGNK